MPLPCPSQAGLTITRPCLFTKAANASGEAAVGLSHSRQRYASKSMLNRILLPGVEALQEKSSPMWAMKASRCAVVMNVSQTAAGRS